MFRASLNLAESFLRTLLILILFGTIPSYAGFVPVSIPGLGDADYSVTSFAVFPPFLAAGSYDSVEGGQVWLSRDGHHWTNSTGSADGFGNFQNTRVNSLVPFKGQLFAGVNNSTTGCEVWRTPTGTGWNQVAGSGFGIPSYANIVLLSNAGMLLAGLGASWSPPASRIFRSPTGTFGTWTVIDSTTNGFGIPDNMSVSALAYFKGRLYAGTKNQMTGSQIWTSADMTNWTLSSNSSGGFKSAGLPPAPQTINSFAVYSNRLYAAGDDGSIHRTSDGTNWEQVRSGVMWMGSINALAVRGNELWATGRDPATFRGMLIKSVTGNPGSWITVNNDGWNDWSVWENSTLSVWSNAVFVGVLSGLPEGRIQSDLAFDYVELDRTADIPEQFVAAGTTNTVSLAFQYSDKKGHKLSRLYVSNRLDAAASDVPRLKLWYDNDSSASLSTGDLPVASGVAFFSNTSGLWEFSGLKVASGSRLLLTADCAFTATTNRAFRPFIRGYLHDGNAVCTNGGSNITGFSNPDAIRIGAHRYAATMPIVVPSTQVGYTNWSGKEFAVLRLTNSAGHGLFRLTIRNAGTMGPADINWMYAYLDTDYNGTWSPSDAWTGISFTYDSSSGAWTWEVPSWSTVQGTGQFVIVAGTAVGGTPGRTFRAVVEPGDVVWTCGAFNTTKLSNSGTITRADEVRILKIADIPQTNILAGTSDATALWFDTRDYYGHTNSYLSIRNAGTAEAGVDVSAVRIWRDASAPFGRRAAGDVLLSTGFWDPAIQAWRFTGIGLVPGTNYLISVSFTATARSNRTFRPAVEVSGLRCTRGVESTVAVTNLGSLVIRNTNDLVTVQTNPLVIGPAYTLGFASSNREIFAFSYRDTKSAHTLRILRLTNLGTMQAGSDISAVKVWQDLGTTGRFERGTDVFAGILTWSAASRMWTNHALSIPEGANILVTVDAAATLSSAGTFRAATVSPNSIRCSGGISANRALTNRLTLTVETNPPLTPVLTGVFPGPSALRLEWTGPTNQDLAGYEIAWDTVSRVSWDQYAFTKIIAVASATNLTGLISSQDHFVTLRAIDSAGNHSPSTPEIRRRTEGVFTWNLKAVNDPGFGSGAVFQETRAMASFKGALYAGASSGSGAVIYRSVSGVNWTPVIAPGFGDPSRRVISVMTVYSNQLYAGVDLWGGPGGCDIWRSPDGQNWTRVVQGGVEDQSQREIAVIRPFQGALYAGTRYNFGGSPGAELWKSADGATWTKVGSEGFGDPNNIRISGLEAIGGFFYAAVDNWSGAQLWRSPDGSSWTQIPVPWSIDQTEIPAMTVWNGRLVVSTRNWSGAKIWVSENATNWACTISDGHLDPDNQIPLSFAAFSNELFAGWESWTGGRLYRTSDLTNWRKLTSLGFGDADNQTVSSIAAHAGRLYFGTKNFMDGAEVYADIAESLSVVKNADKPDTWVLPGSANNTVLAFKVVSGLSSRFTGLEVRPFGTATTNDILRLRLWYDKDGNASWSASDVAVGFPAYWDVSRQVWRFLGLDCNPGTNLIVTLDFRPDARTNHWFLGMIRTNGVTGFDGAKNTDSAVTNFGRLFAGGLTLHYPSYVVLSNLRPSFSWSSSSSVDTNELLVSTNAFASYYYSARTGGTNHTPASALKEGTNWWQVRSHVQGTTNWYLSTTTLVLLDHTVPQIPLLSAPISNQPFQSVPSLVWTTATDTVSSVYYYGVYASTNANFSVLQFAVPVMAPLTNYAPAALADGRYWWCVQSVDLAGNRSVLSGRRSFILDNQGPAGANPVFPLNAEITNGTSFLFLWSRSADSGLSGVSNYLIVMSSNAWAGTQRSAWSASSVVTQQTFTLGDGAWSWKVSAKDRAGNNGSAGVSRSLIVDTQAPAGASTVRPADGFVTNSSLILFVWNRSADAGLSGISNYRIMVSSNAWVGTQRSAITGSTQQSFTLGDGAWSWKIMARDRALNIGVPGASASLVVDRQSPNGGDGILPVGGKATNASAILFVWHKAFDSGPAGPSNYRIVMSSNAWAGTQRAAWSASSVVTQQSFTLGDAVWSWKVYTRDRAGNIGLPGTVRALIVDTQSPSGPALMRPASGIATNSLTVLFEWNKAIDAGPAGISNYKIVMSSNAWASTQRSAWSASSIVTQQSFTLGEGAWSWEVAAKDKAGNEGPASAVRSLVVDAQGPSVPVLTAPVNGFATNSSAVLFIWNRSSDSGMSGISNYRIVMSSNAWVSTQRSVVSTATQRSFTLGDGVWSWKVLARDRARNMSAWSAVAGLTVDRKPPNDTDALSPVDSFVTNNAAILFVWTPASDAGSSGISNYRIVMSSNSWISTQRSAWSGSSSVTQRSFILGDGPWSWKVYAIDRAGNTGNPGSVKSLTVDTSAPTIPVVHLPLTGSWGNTSNPVIVWTRAVDNISLGGYHLQYSTNISFSTTNFSSIKPAGVTNGTAPGLFQAVWHLRIRAFDHISNLGAWSAIRDFKIDLTLPSAPALSSPATGMPISTPNPTFIFQTASDSGGSGVASYELQVSSSPVFFPTVMTLVTAQTGNTLFGLSDGVWYWRGRTIDTAGNLSGYSTTNSLLIDTTPPPQVSLVSPFSGTVHRTNVVMAWSGVADGLSGRTNYIIEIASNAGFLPVNTRATLSGTNYQRPSVLSDGLWYWRVAAVDKAGNIGVWSFVRSLKEDTTPPTVSLVSPLDLETVSAMIALFSWNASDLVSGVSNYLFRIDTNGNPGDGLEYFNVTNIGTLNFGTLLPGTNWWQAGAVDKAGWTNWYGVSRFIVDTNLPLRTLIAPLNTVFSNLRPVFVWSASLHGDTNILQVSDDSFASVLFSGVTVQTSLAGPADCTEGTNWWRILSRRISNGQWYTSAIRRFTVDRTGPAAAPAPIGPADGAMLSVLPLLVWNRTTDAVSGISNYTVLMSSNAFVSTQRTIVSGLTNVAPGLSQGVWFWKLFARDRSGNPSPVSSVSSFTLDSVYPSAPVPVTPASNAITTNSSVLIAWTRSNDATLVSYRVLMSSNAFISTQRTWLTNAAVTNILATGFSEAVWSWKVEALDAAGNSSWSALSFFTVDRTPPTGVSLVSPASNSVSSNRGIVFRWTRSSGASAYIVQMSTNNFASTDRSFQVAATNSPAIPVLDTGRWVWRVAAVDGAGLRSGFSSVWSVRIISNAGTPLQPVSDDPNGTRVFPNPLYGGESLSVDRLPRKSVVRIFNEAGYRIAQKEIRSYDGTRVEIWSPSEEASGVYLVVIEDSETKQRVVRRIIYLSGPRSAP